MEQGNGLLVIEDVAVSEIYAQFEESNQLISETADSLGVSEDTVKEAVEFKQKYPLEVHRDAVRKQMNRLQEELEFRRKALDAFLEDCRQ